MYDNVNFQSCYRISGTLRTLSPLHIGSGIPGIRGVKKTDKDGKEIDGKEIDVEEIDGKEIDVEVSLVCTNAENLPFIPGSTLKGVISSWLKERNLTSPEFHSVFGQIDSFGNPVQGGKA